MKTCNYFVFLNYTSIHRPPTHTNVDIHVRVHVVMLVVCEFVILYPVEVTKIFVVSVVLVGFF